MEIPLQTTKATGRGQKHQVSGLPSAFGRFGRALLLFPAMLAVFLFHIVFHRLSPSSMPWLRRHVLGKPGVRML